MGAPGAVARLRLLTSSAAATTGWLASGELRFRCAIGRGGIRSVKREGDGATPRGRYHLQRVLYRPDAGRRPNTGLPLDRIRPDDGWCDAIGDRNYNRKVSHPYLTSAERLWRDDRVYDIVVVTSHNQRPRVQGLGSAIFMHVARPGFAPTAGCIALRKPDLARILARLPAHATIDMTRIDRPVVKRSGPAPAGRRAR
jgi:L,D-peptidoglycan transpeptidase YkuD (ErfK/YbiS/YcfS/YnhG family)